jgi:hypothetical protein
MKAAIKSREAFEVRRIPALSIGLRGLVPRVG